MQLLTEIANIHLEFIYSGLHSLQLDPRPISALPSFVFLFSIFIFFHNISHRRTQYRTSFTTFFLREMSLQFWLIYAYESWKLWLDIARWLVNCDVYLQETLKAFYLTCTHSKAFVLTIHAVLSCFPLSVLIYRYLKRHTIPLDFFIGGVNTSSNEIGNCRYYLTRPVRKVETERKIVAYLKKCKSVEGLTCFTKMPIKRRCNSLKAIKL